MDHTAFDDPAPRLGLFGYGAFGRLVALGLRDRARIVVHDPAPAAAARAAADGFALGDAAEVAGCPIVVLAVPVAALEDCLRAIAGLVRPGALVADVGSVKEGPARLMAAILPPGVSVLATHPLFGPASLGAGLRGGRVVLCPVRGEWRGVARALRGLGLRAIRRTPEAHDREVALTQGVVHMVARMLGGIEGGTPLATRSYEALAAALAMVRDDPPELVAAILEGNAHVAPLRARLRAALG
ncbi:prephenate dehydrogenase [Frigidibacter sp. MR17.24]|uniref:prephenate dehydrogenase n=1 Tax=Frigidibacter sp. MR17.24 TaxID=3127345 RepID=UPI003012A4FB